MTQLLRQFVESAIDLHRNVFTIARLKLTALYVGILAVIICGFSLFLYLSVLHNLQDASEDDFKGAAAQEHFIHHTIEPFRDTILISDLVILIAAGGVSYWLAGRTLRPIQRSLEAQQLFAAQASHELRTPLTIMRNDIEVLLKNEHPSINETRTILKSNIEEIQNMTSLVNGLLVLARSENASGESIFVNLSELIGGVIERLTPFAKEKGLMLTASIEDSLVVQGDPLSLEQMFLNVVQNSLKYTKEGSVEVKGYTSNGSAVIAIRDTGIGIASEDLPHVLTPFYKSKKTQNIEGNGLGLSIVQEIVRQYKGTLHIQSTENKGTTVSISLLQ